MPVVEGCSTDLRPMIAARRSLEGLLDPAVEGTFSDIDSTDGVINGYHRDVRPVAPNQLRGVRQPRLPEEPRGQREDVGTLVQDGLELVSDHDEADAIVVNTCGFMESSKDESLEVIREAIQRKESGDLSRVVVAGCLVQRHRAKLLQWAPGIDAMIGVFDRDHVLEAVRGVAPPRENAIESPEAPRYWISGNALQAAGERGMETTGLTVHGKDGKGIGYFEDDSGRLTPRHWAYLRVSEGCNQKCAFCTIPSIRGKCVPRGWTGSSRRRGPGQRGVLRTEPDRAGHHQLRYDVGYSAVLVGMPSRSTRCWRRRAAAGRA